MSESQMLLFLNNYGLFFVFVIVFMEYLNLPGFPSGIIMPAVGFWSNVSGMPFGIALLVSVAAGLLGSLILYFVGKYGGNALLDKFYSKHPKSGAKLKAFEERLHKRAGLTVFVSKLIPVVRTLIGFPAGAIQMKLSHYLIYSAFGILIWNGVLMFSGTALGQITW